MEHIVNLHIEKLSEGFYLGTSDDIQGLVAQGPDDPRGDGDRSRRRQETPRTEIVG
jgi:hypothetical protein